MESLYKKVKVESLPYQPSSWMPTPVKLYLHGRPSQPDSSDPVTCCEDNEVGRILHLAGAALKPLKMIKTEKFKKVLEIYQKAEDKYQREYDDQNEDFYEKLPAKVDVEAMRKLKDKCLINILETKVTEEPVIAEQIDADSLNEISEKSSVNSSLVLSAKDENLITFSSEDEDEPPFKLPPAPIFPDNSHFVCIVTHIEKSDLVYLVPTLVPTVPPTNFDPSICPPLENAAPNTPCLAPYSKDDCWYRAVITRVHDRTWSTIFYVDYGYSCRLELNKLLCMPNEFREIPQQATLCRLADVRDVQEDDFHGESDYVSAVVNLISSRELLCKVERGCYDDRSVGGSTWVRLYLEHDGGEKESLRDMLVDYLDTAEW